jgi:hypothetical protein
MPIQNPSYPTSLGSSEGFRSPLPSFSPNTVPDTLFRFRDLLSGLFPQVSLSFLNSRECCNRSTDTMQGAALYAQRLDEPAPAYMTHVGHGDANHDYSMYCIVSLSLMRRGEKEKNAFLLYAYSTDQCESCVKIEERESGVAAAV